MTEDNCPTLLLFGRMRAIANAEDEASYHAAVTALKSSPLWRKNERLRVWFERYWLSASKVSTCKCLNLFRISL